ncbi:MAG: PAS domain S-box protein [Candidatus Solibacter sp.]|nr:PAS domain S-box protein [Candidatus Solibacter sp.]
MSDKVTHSGDAAELRRRAEEIYRGAAAQGPDNLDGLSPAEVRRTHYELRVHQIELEIQNAELRRAQTELDTQRARYFDLYDLAPVGYCTVSQQGLILEANLTAAGLLGVARGALLQRRLTKFVFREDEDLYYRHRRQLLEAGEPQVFELRLVKKDGTAFWVRLKATAAKDAGGAPVAHFVIIDIKRRKRAEENYRTLFREMLNGFALYEIVYDGQGMPADYRFLAVNPAFERMTGLKAQDVLGKSALEVMPCIEPNWVEAYDKVAVTGEPAFFENCAVALNKHFEVTAFRPAPNQFACIFADITARKRAEKELRLAHAEMSAIYASVPVALMLVDRNRQVTKLNNSAANFAGRPAEEMLDLRLGEAVRCLHSLDDPRGCGFGPSCASCQIRLAVIRTFADGKSRDQVEAVLPIDAGQGADLRCLLISTAYLGSKDTGRVLISAQDITQRKRDEVALRATVCKMELAVQEKTVLLREIHHRVKNNLAVTASLLSMKADGSGPEAQLALEESRQRIHSIALVHEHLYSHEGLQCINFAEYARELVQGVYSTFGGELRGIGLDLHLDPIELSIERAVPCALILNELLSNAFKYAFAGGRTGRILVSFHQPEPGCCELAVADDGPGLPDGAFTGQTQSLGLRIVHILTNQLDGSVEQKPTPGTRIVLRFPVGHQSEP